MKRLSRIQNYCLKNFYWNTENHLPLQGNSSPGAFVTPGRHSPGTIGRTCTGACSSAPFSESGLRFRHCELLTVKKNMTVSQQTKNILFFSEN